MSDYNGWTNWETWNVALWVDNDEPLYRRKWARKPKTADEVEAFVREMMPNGTPDMDDTNGGYAAVNWDEIAENWCLEYDDEAGA